MPKPTRDEMAALVERLRVDAHEYAVAEMFEETITLEREAADALEALMQEREEPVAWLLDAEQYAGVFRDKAQVEYWAKKPGYTVTPLYAAPPAKPAGELPPLPEPIFDDPKGRGHDLFSAEQMRAYAMRAIREAK